MARLVTALILDENEVQDPLRPFMTIKGEAEFVQAADVDVVLLGKGKVIKNRYGDIGDVVRNPAWPLPHDQALHSERMALLSLAPLTKGVVR